MNLGFIKIKNFCSVNDTVKMMKRQIAEWKKLLTEDECALELLSKIQKELLKFNNKKTKYFKMINDFATGHTQNNSKFSRVIEIK